MSSPSEELAKKITSKLIESKLVMVEDQEVITSKLSQGKLQQEDWRLAIEKGIDAKEES